MLVGHLTGKYLYALVVVVFCEYETLRFYAEMDAHPSICYQIWIQLSVGTHIRVAKLDNGAKKTCGALFAKWTTFRHYLSYFDNT